MTVLAQRLLNKAGNKDCGVRRTMGAYCRVGPEIRLRLCRFVITTIAALSWTGSYSQRSSPHEPSWSPSKISSMKTRRRTAAHLALWTTIRLSTPQTPRTRHPHRSISQASRFRAPRPCTGVPPTVMHTRSTIRAREALRMILTASSTISRMSPPSHSLRTPAGTS